MYPSKRQPVQSTTEVRNTNRTRNLKIPRLKKDELIFFLRGEKLTFHPLFSNISNIAQRLTNTTKVGLINNWHKRTNSRRNKQTLYFLTSALCQNHGPTNAKPYLLRTLIIFYNYYNCNDASLIISLVVNCNLNHTAIEML